MILFGDRHFNLTQMVWVAWQWAKTDENGAVEGANVLFVGETEPITLGAKQAMCLWLYCCNKELTRSRENS